ncbi:MAG: hypothetical protein DRP42_03860 [Tenericutes bacterium]|nr:MAG: hypothetical protein DRP42_03860 [Mycoplasmatota bacterium]
MPDTDIGEAIASDLTNEMTDYSVSAQTTDGATGEQETRWQTSTWSESLGYYKAIPEFKTAVDAKALWTVGAGFEADESTMLLLGNIKGNGKDSFNSILKNLIVTKTIDSDSYAEIIRHDDGFLANLKPLDPSSIVIVQNNKGRIKRYEQVSKRKKVVKTFQPNEIFHLSNNRIADEIHGIRILDSLKWLINARNEAMTDWKVVLHRLVKPTIIWHLDTDDQTKIANFKSTTDKATSDNENIYVPKGAVVPEVLSVAANATLNPLNWINQLNDYFFQAVNVPQIIIGNAKEFTDASGKIVYLAYEQSVKGEQLYIEEQVLGQLNLYIELTFPASLQQDTISDTSSEVEEEPIEQATQPNDTTAEMEGKK